MERVIPERSMLAADKYAAVAPFPKATRMPAVYKSQPAVLQRVRQHLAQAILRDEPGTGKFSRGFRASEVRIFQSPIAPSDSSAREALAEVWCGILRLSSTRA
jgi:hypothetical protein